MRAQGNWTLNDAERQQWCDNDEGLYNMQRMSAMSKRAFIREHRDELDAYIRALGTKPAPAPGSRYERPQW